MTFPRRVFTVRSIPHPHSLPVRILQKSGTSIENGSSRLSVRGPSEEYLEVLPGIQGALESLAKAASGSLRAGGYVLGQRASRSLEAPHALVR